jgi:phage gpG-like protein
MSDTSKIQTFNLPTQAQTREAIIALAGEVGLKAEQFFRESFRRQGFIDKIFIPWKKRQGGKATRKFGDGGKISGGAILVKTGNLRRSVYRTQASLGDGSVAITFGNQVPYAAAHNDGFKGTVNIGQHSRRLFTKVKTKMLTKSGKTRNKTDKVQKSVTTVQAHTRAMNLPRRRFIGPSQELNLMVEKMLTQTGNQLLNP